MIRGTNKSDRLVDTPNNDTLLGLQGNDTLVSKRGNDTLEGRQGNDTLYQGSGKTVLEGGNGRDVLRGRSGNATFYGGNGSDIFALDTGKGVVTVQDFSAVKDKIFLPDNLGFSDITLRQQGRNTVVKDSNDVLATLANTKASELTAANFTSSLTFG